MPFHRPTPRGVCLGLLTLLLAACSAAPATFTAESIPAATLPPPLPVFNSDILNPNDTPHGYIQDTCKYLKARWSPNSAEPGTVVMIVMLGRVRGGPALSPTDIEDSELKRVMIQLREQGFEAITTEQLLDFMERNARIPPRSVVLVRDGNFEKRDYLASFYQYWLYWKWSIVNGWVSEEYTPNDMWRENIMMEREGFVDHQAGGMKSDTLLTEDSSKVIIARELQGSLEAFDRHFSKTPIAFVWPNGGFGQRPVEIARLLGYQLGFTMNARGPVMYNWVPLADAADPARPDYIPEGNIHDPLMTLPRYLPSQVFDSIDQVRILGNTAKAYAEANQAAELEYYQGVCEATYGPIPTPSK